MADINSTCDYIALTNTDQAANICEKYGYGVDANNPQHVSDTLVGIISENEMPVLKEILSIHPDKDVIVEMFGTPRGNNRLNACGACNPIQNYDRYQSFYGIGGSPGATGSSWSGEKHLMPSMISMQTNTILIVGIVVIGAALIFKHKN